MHKRRSKFDGTAYHSASTMVFRLTAPEEALKLPLVIEGFKGHHDSILALVRSAKKAVVSDSTLVVLF